MNPFAPGSLWSEVCRTTSEALATGHLLPIKTSSLVARDAGMQFVIRVVDGLSRKPRLVNGLSTGNPFLPCDPHLVVADLSATHRAVLNKFMVVDHHLLIVTREFVAQEEPLQPSDFQALALCLLEYDSVGFYNSGPSAGASQPHRHLQLVPLPLDRRLDGIPVAAELNVDAAPAGRVLQSNRLTFAHRWWRFPPSVKNSASALAIACHEAYDALVASVGWSCVSAETPYNLLVTREWLMLVPRRAECFEGISLNALAYMGALLVHNEQQLAQLVNAGPMAALRLTAGC